MTWTMRRSVRAFFMVGVMLAAGVALADRERGDPSPGKPRDETQVAATPRAPTTEPDEIVFDNEYLNKRFGLAEAQSGVAPGTEPSPAAPATPSATTPAPPPWDPLKEIEESQRGQAERDKQVREAEQTVEQARKRIAEVENRLRAVRNPYLPPPRQPEEGGEDWAGMDGAERAKRTEEDLAKAREELDRAQHELSRLRSGG